MRQAYDDENFYVGGNELCEIKGFLAKDDEGIEDLMDCIDMTIDWPDVLMERLQETLCDIEGNIGLLIKVEVDESLQGEGRGGALLNEYIEAVGTQSAVDILFARVDNEQVTGIDLRKFYESRGFESVHKCDGSLLMANKGFRAHFLERLLPHRAHAPVDAGIELPAP